MAVGIAAAVVALSAGAGAAHAATAGGPSASLTFAAAQVNAGTRPVLRFAAPDAPAGSVLYLEEANGSGQSWRLVGRIKAESGAVRLPSDPAGHYEYRILVVQGDTVVDTSAPASLTVRAATPEASATGSTCTACQIVKDALPWLAPIVVPIVAPVIASVAQGAGQAILGFLALIFG